MAKKAIRKIPRTGEAGAKQQDNCPKCHSTRLAGLMAAFWAELTPTGGMVNDFASHEADTEIGTERMCLECDHEFTL